MTRHYEHEWYDPALRQCQPLCGHCLAPTRGYASVNDQRLCHPDDGMDCYHLVTVYGHTMPCDCDGQLRASDRVPF